MYSNVGRIFVWELLKWINPKLAENLKGELITEENMKIVLDEFAKKINKEFINEEDTVTSITKINENICGNNYKVCLTEPCKDNEIIIYGELQNFNPSENVVFYVEDKGLYIIPYVNIKWMLPNGLSNQRKDKIKSYYKIMKGE